jgi:penicillin amidase
LDGVNQFQATHPAPIEFDLAGIPKRAFTLQDTVAVSGYLAYSFAAAIKTEPVLSFIHDELDAKYLEIFDLEWNPLGVLSPARSARLKPDWQALSQLAQVSQQAMDVAAVPLFEGSNAWAVSGQRTSSGKPMLVGDPHIGFALPAVWYEAHLKSPGFELYGHFQALNALALLGHNQNFGWSLTMFQNDDMDLIAETVNPFKPTQVKINGEWVEMESRQETILVKGAKPVALTLQRSPHGPIISSAFRESWARHRWHCGGLFWKPRTLCLRPFTNSTGQTPSPKPAARQAKSMPRGSTWCGPTPKATLAGGRQPNCRFARLV